MNQEILEPLIRNARKDLIEYPRVGVKKSIKNALKVVLGRGNSIQKRDFISWPNGLLALAIEDNDIEDDILGRYVDQWISKGSSIRSVEDAVSGLAFLIKGEGKFEDAARKIYEYLLSAPKDKEGSFLYNPNQSNEYILVDMIGMVCPFLACWGKKYSSDEAYDIAETQIINFVKYGMDDETLLPFHGYELCTDSKLGIVGWGRAVGWLLMGEAGYLAYAPKDRPNYDVIEKQFKITLDTIRKYQNESDLYEWKIDIFPKKIDTSASAMILYSIATWIERKRLENCDEIEFSQYFEMLERGSAELFTYIKKGKVYGAQAECLGLGLHPDKFGAYPWSLGPTISLLSRCCSVGVIKC